MGRSFKTGAGILVLQGNNSFSGVGVEISAGTIQMANASALGSGNVAVDSGGTLDLNGLNLGSTLTLTGPGAPGCGCFDQQQHLFLNYLGTCDINGHWWIDFGWR